MYYLGVDLGQKQDPTALALVTLPSESVSLNSL